MPNLRCLAHEDFRLRMRQNVALGSGSMLCKCSLNHTDHHRRHICDEPISAAIADDGDGITLLANCLSRPAAKARARSAYSRHVKVRHLSDPARTTRFLNQTSSCMFEQALRNGRLWHGPFLVKLSLLKITGISNTFVMVTQNGGGKLCLEVKSIHSLVAPCRRRRSFV